MKHKIFIFLPLCKCIKMDFDKILSERHSVRNFSDRSVDLKKVVEIMNAGRFAPSAGNIFTVRFILVKDKETKEKLADAAYEQHFIAKAQYIIVVCSELTRMKKAYGERGLIYARQQAGASIQNMLLKVVDLGLGSCWTGAFHDETIKKILKIPNEVSIEAMLPVGYPAGKKVEKKKYSLDVIVHKDKWED